MEVQNYVWRPFFLDNLNHCIILVVSNQQFYMYSIVEFFLNGIDICCQIKSDMVYHTLVSIPACELTVLFFESIWLKMSSLFVCRTNSSTCWRMFATRFANLSNAFILPWFSDKFSFLFLSLISYLIIFNKNSIHLFLYFFFNKIFPQQRFLNCELKCTWTSITHPALLFVTSSLKNLSLRN